jgi:hypothetical protein
VDPPLNMYISPSGLWTDTKYSKIYQKQHKNLNGKIIKPYDVEWLFWIWNATVTFSGGLGVLILLSYLKNIHRRYESTGRW